MSSLLISFHWELSHTKKEAPRNSGSLPKIHRLLFVSSDARKSIDLSGDSEDVISSAYASRCGVSVNDDRALTAHA